LENWRRWAKLAFALGPKHYRDDPDNMLFKIKISADRLNNFNNKCVSSKITVKAFGKCSEKIKVDAIQHIS
jgi:hypothetical protein